MARKKIKPFSRIEMKILIYNKMKKGLSYEEARKEVSKEIEELLLNSNKKTPKRDKNEIFKEEFEKLINGNKEKGLYFPYNLDFMFNFFSNHYTLFDF